MEDIHRLFINILQENTKVRPIQMNATAESTLITPQEPRIVIPRPVCPPLSPAQDKILANVAFTYERGIYRPFRIVMMPEAPHAPASELKPSCVRINPVTRIGHGLSTPSQLADWCNNLAASVGVYQPDPETSFFYHCNPSRFSRTKAKAA